MERDMWKLVRELKIGDYWVERTKSGLRLFKVTQIHLGDGVVRVYGLTDTGKMYVIDVDWSTSFEIPG